MQSSYEIILYETDYDLVCFGTGLTESILCASLAKTGQKILVIDID